EPGYRERDYNDHDKQPATKNIPFHDDNPLLNLRQAAFQLHEPNYMALARAWSSCPGLRPVILMRGGYGKLLSYAVRRQSEAATAL
ncbi:MAG TPA: hypothetical protein VK137_13865, partial [Planctomycetaceae bacterium]|nr:hypothetical protein [Planctomycetaceae bacterium]